jgi:hypothetical protein
MIRRLKIGEKKEICRCGKECGIHSWRTRKVQGLGTKNEALRYEITTAAYVCKHCKRHWYADVSDLVMHNRRHTNEVIMRALELRDEYTDEAVSQKLLEDYFVRVKGSTIKRWYYDMAGPMREQKERKRALEEWINDGVESEEV